MQYVMRFLTMYDTLGYTKLAISLSWLDSLLGQNQCHSTGVKKSYFGHSFNLRQKKFSGGWKVTLVSDCLHFWTFRHTETKWTQSLTIFLSLSETQSDPKVIKSFFLKLSHRSFHRTNLNFLFMDILRQFWKGVLTAVNLLFPRIWFDLE